MLKVEVRGTLRQDAGDAALIAGSSRRAKERSDNEGSNPFTLALRHRDFFLVIYFSSALLFLGGFGAEIWVFSTWWNGLGGNKRGEAKVTSSSEWTQV